MSEDFRMKCEQILEYLEVERHYSVFTITFYKHDLKLFSDFVEKEQIPTLEDIDDGVVRIFLTELYDRKLERTSVSRTLSCLRSFYAFMETRRFIHQNPFLHI